MQTPAEPAYHWKNGSGKSTILKIITGVIQPSEGTIAVNGKVSALLELGAGFDMEYSGVENIYMNGGRTCRFDCFQFVKAFCLEKSISYCQCFISESGTKAGEILSFYIRDEQKNDVVVLETGKTYYFGLLTKFYENVDHSP